MDWNASNRYPMKNHNRNIEKRKKNFFSPQFQLCRPLVTLKHNCSVLRRPIVYRLARGYNTKYLRILCAESGDSLALDSAGSGVDSRCAWRAKVKVAAFSVQRCVTVSTVVMRHAGPCTYRYFDFSFDVIK